MREKRNPGQIYFREGRKGVGHRFLATASLHLHADSIPPDREILIVAR
jgi:hypothetical protein